MTVRDAAHDRRRRAACMVRLARETGDDVREAEAMRLVIIECHDQGVIPSEVFAAARDITGTGGDLQAVLIAELARLKAILGPVELPPLPDPGDVGGAP